MLIQTGKVWVNEVAVTDPRQQVRAGATLAIMMNTPRRATQGHSATELLVHVDPHVVVVRKPPGINTVPFEEKEEGSLDQLIRVLLNKQKRVQGGPHQSSLGIVHRLDRDTTGLLVFARTLAAKKNLSSQFRAHTVRRRYEALVYGNLQTQTICSYLVTNRGDGRRGSTRLQGTGLYAVTHVEALETFAEASRIACRLETGRTHQIRIHLSEAGHPLIGEKVYVRQLKQPPIASARIMLHAQELGFVHPHTQQEMTWHDPLPDDFNHVLRQLRPLPASR